MALLTVAVMLLCIAETFIDAHPFEIVESSVQFFNDRHNERNNNPQEYSIQSRMIETIDNLSPKKPLEVIEKTYESLKPAAPETVQSDAEKKESDNAEIHHSAGIIVPSGESALTSQNQELAELYSYFSDDERFKEALAGQYDVLGNGSKALPTPLNGNSALETLAGAGAVALMAYGISYALPFAAAVPIVGRRSDTSEIMDASPNNPISNLVKWMRGRYGAQKRSYHGAPHPRLNRGGNTYPESNFGFDEYIEDFEPAFRHRRPNERQHQKDNFNNFNTYEFPAREETFSEDGFKFDFPEDDGRYGDDPTNEHKSMFGEVTYEYDFSNADVTPPSYDLYERNNEVNAKSTTARDLSPHKQTSGAPSYRPPKRPPMRYRGPSFRFPKLPKLKLPTLPPYQFPKLPTVEVPIPKRHHVADHVMDFVRDFRSRVPNHLVNQHRAPPKKPQPSYKPGPPAKPAPKPQGYRPPSSRAARPFGRRPMRHHASPKMDTEEDIIFAEGSSELPTYVSLEQINRLAEEEMEGVVKGYSRRYNAPWPPPSDQSTIIFESPEQDFRSDRLGEPAHESGEGGHPHGLDYSDFHYVDIRGSKDIIDEPEKSDNGEQIQQPGTSDFETKQFRRRNRNPSRQFQHKSINEATSSGFVPGGPPPSQRRDKKSVGKLEHQYRERENVQLQKPYWHS